MLGKLPERIRVFHSPTINEFHPLVRRLVQDFNYTLAHSIEAVQCCGTSSLPKCMDYLDENVGDEEYTFSETTVEER